MNPTAEEKEAHAQACSLLAVIGGLSGATLRVRGGGATAQPSRDAEGARFAQVRQFWCQNSGSHTMAPKLRI